MTEALDLLHPVLVHHLVNTLGWRALRPLQDQAVQPVMSGADALLLAPTAGGKTEAAILPVLSAMERGRWTGLSVLYVCPLKALLNNVLPRMDTYAGWVGRRVALWHGDVPATARRAILRDLPDILLTTPESLESMLVSVNVDQRHAFAGLRTVIVDEVHAFAGDDRGWHLLAVLERLARVAGRDLQRIGLSATVGNPPELLSWLQGAGRGRRPAELVSPPAGAATPVEVEVDYVGSVANAAKVIATLHRGEKRLVFCDSRRLVEELGSALRLRGVRTYLSHASMLGGERRPPETAFAAERDCVIVATSTLELGIDVGDLDRVIQIDAPRTVASFLQRVGRTGRRAGAIRSCLFLALDADALLWAGGLLLLWSRGFVEPVDAPPEPRHVVAQQLLALCLQENAIGRQLWDQAWNGLAPFDRTAGPIVQHLLDSAMIERDGEMLFIGPTAEKQYGRRHFMDMTAVFTAPPQFTVFAGRREIGRTDPAVLTRRVDGPRLLLLAGRSWRVTWIDWKRRRCFVEEAERGGVARWHTPGIQAAGYDLTRAAREVLLGADPPVALTSRAQHKLAEVRETRRGTAHPAGTVLARSGDDLRWWTWAGYRANATLAATLADILDANQRVDDLSLRLSPDLTPAGWRAATADAATRICLPEVDDQALRGLKFSDALPYRLATATLATRLADVPHAAAVLAEPARFVVG
jgi:ATP-dependent helicase Lhr and Lhr-like helicase